MQEVGAFEARNRFGALLERVVNGEEILITRRGKPVARLVPSGADAGRAVARTAAASLRALAREIQGPPLRWDELKSSRDEGRR